MSLTPSIYVVFAMSVELSSIDDELLPINLATVSLTTAIGINVYLKPSHEEPAILYSAGHVGIAPEQLKELIEEGCTKLYIHHHDRDTYQQAMRESWQELLLDQQMPAIDRVAALNDIVRNILQYEFEHGTTDSIVAKCQSLGQSSVEALGNDPIVLKDLVRVLSHDYGTFTHTTNVSAYAVLLGRALGFNEEDLVGIAIGGLLHDIGKLDIDQQILNKPGKLDELERKQIELHPTLGLQRVIMRDDLSEGALMMIYQHHERVNGQGYPVGLSGDQIHPWGRLCAIVDVYEALTSERPYRKALSHQTAMAVLEKGNGTEFDREMLACWQQLLVN